MPERPTLYCPECGYTVVVHPNTYRGAGLPTLECYGCASTLKPGGAA